MPHDRPLCLFHSKKDFILTGRRTKSKGTQFAFEDTEYADDTAVLFESRENLVEFIQLPGSGWRCTLAILIIQRNPQRQRCYLFRLLRLHIPTLQHMIIVILTISSLLAIVIFPFWKSFAIRVPYLAVLVRMMVMWDWLVMMIENQQG